MLPSHNNIHLNDQNLLYGGNICNLLHFLRNFNNEKSNAESDNDPDESLVNLDEDDRKVKFINDIRNVVVKYIHIIIHEFINELLPKLIQETGELFRNVL